jgi:hypothetical protein
MRRLFLPARGTVVGAMASFNVEVAACSADPADFIDRTQPTKLEIPFGHAFDKHGLSLPKRAVRVRRLRSASRAAPTRAGRRRKTEGALRDHHYRVTTVEDAMRQSRSMPWAGQLLRPLVWSRMTGRTRPCSKRLRARRSQGNFKPAHGRIPRSSESCRHSPPSRTLCRYCRP